jgi:hypothetical protein
MKIPFYLFLFVACHCFAQEDYIVLNTNDTLYGEVRRGNLASDWVMVKNEEGRQSIHLREVREWKSGDRPVVVIPKTKKKRTYYLELLRVVDGEIRLYKDYFLLWTDNYFVVDDRKFIQLINENLHEVLLMDLFKCESFSEK